MTYQLKMLKFGSQDCHHSPWKALPEMAPWHHVRATIEITLNKNWSSFARAGTQSWNMQNKLWQPCRFETTQCNSLITVETKCCRCTELIRPFLQHKWIAFFGAVSAVLCTPLHLDLERERTKEEKEREEVLHLFRCYTHTHKLNTTWHTHT